MIKHILLVATLLYGAQVGGLGTLTRTSAIAGPCAGTIACYYINEGSGSTFVDHSGNSNNVTVGTPSSIAWGTNAGFPGSSATFNGSLADAQTSVTLPGLDGTTPFSIGLWFYGNGPNNGQWLLSSENFSSNQAGIYLFTNNAGCPTLLLGIIANVSTSNYISTSAGGLSVPCMGNGGLFYIVVTYDGSQKAAGIIYYINGTSVGITTQVDTDSLTSPITTAGPMYLGQRSTAGTYPLNGILQYVKFYNHVLTSGQVAANYAAGPS